MKHLPFLRRAKSKLNTSSSKIVARLSEILFQLTYLKANLKLKIFQCKQVMAFDTEKQLFDDVMTSISSSL